MEKVIIIKYAELSTKSDNINFFIKTLKHNIEKKLNGISFKISYDVGRMIIYTDNIDIVLNKLKEVFGIHEIMVGYIFKEKSIEQIEENILNLIKDKDFNTFRVTTKRSDKHYEIKSIDFSKKVGAYILKNTNNKKVKVEGADLEIFVEIRINEILVYFDGIKGLGGYPVSTLGKGLLMLSGGIDSPVAGFLAIKRGIRLEAIYFDSPPHTSKMALEKVKDLAKVLAKYNNDEIRIHVINFTHIQEEIIKNIPNYYLITIMRRFMYQISAIIASKINAHVIINGESVGQVASQTLKSMEVINESIKKPVLRPVCCFDKLEIIDIARKIGTYDISTLPYEDCCTIFVPKHPVIHPDLKTAIEYEKLINKDELIYEAVKNENIIKINSNNDLEYKDLL